MTKKKTKVVKIIKKEAKMKTARTQNSFLHNALVLHNIKKIWQEYFDGSSFDSFNYIYGTKKRLTNIRLFFSICFIICQMVVSYQCYISVQRYYSYKIQTIITYDTFPNLPFPAISFYNTYFGRKSVVGLDEMFIYFVSAYVARNNETDIIYKTSQRTCKSNITKSQTEIDDYKAEFMMYLSNPDFTKLYEVMGFDSYLNVDTCWWNKTKVNCRNIFVNHYFEDSFSFTFNQDPSYLDMGGAYHSYGMEPGTNENRTLKNQGERNGFQVLLNTRQDEYCVTTTTRYGAGFQVLIHGGQSQSSPEMLSTVNLSPGFFYTISLRPILFDMRNFSESLGKCTSYVFNFMTPNRAEYVQANCFFACLFEQFWRICKCLLVSKSSALFSKTTADYLGVPVTKLIDCNLLNLSVTSCIADVKEKFYSIRPDINCPHCKRKCLDIMYEYQVTAQKFSLSMLKNIANISDTSIDSAKKNFVFAKFSYQSLQMQTVRELQFITPLDLFNNLGSNLGLFLGMSVLTLYEVVHLLLMTFYIEVRSYLTKWNSKKRKKSIRTVKRNSQFIIEL